MSDAAAILSVGRLYCDLVFSDLPRLPSLGTEVFAGGFSVHAGGGAFITAAHFAALGHPAALAARVPAAPFRDPVMADLAAADLDTTLCTETPPGTDPQVTVALNDGADRAFVTRRTGPAYGPLTADDIAGTGARHLHIGELTTLLEHPDLIPLARGAEMTISLDCAWDDDLDLARARTLIAAVDVFLPNADEARMLTDHGLSPPFAPLTVVKEGAKGATAFRDGQAQCAATRPARVIDTTGAGDAFNAGFLSSWLAGGDLASCLGAGNIQGRQAVSQRGGFQPQGRSDRATA